MQPVARAGQESAAWRVRPWTIAAFVAAPALADPAMSMAVAPARRDYERRPSRLRPQAHRSQHRGEICATGFEHRTIETTRSTWAQFRTMKKYRYFNTLLAGKKFYAKRKMRFGERR
jgi:hypothetical protein